MGAGSQPAAPLPFYKLFASSALAACTGEVLTVGCVVDGGGGGCECVYVCWW